MEKNSAHFVLFGSPLCCNLVPAFAQRLAAAGSPPCSDVSSKQARRFVRLAAQFPGKVSLVHGKCPHAVAALRKAREVQP